MSIALGWYVDHHAHGRRELLGEWYYPTNDVNVTGYTSLLNLRKNGTFTKVQGYRMNYETFDGTYDIDENGRVDFHVTSRTEGSDVFNAISRAAEQKGMEIDSTPTVTQIDERHSCRCGIDSDGFLVIDAKNWNIGQESSGIQWETHARETDYNIRARD